MACESRQALRGRGCGSVRAGLPIRRGVRKRRVSRRPCEWAAVEGKSPVGESMASPERFPK